MKSQSQIPNDKHQIPKIQLLASGLVPLGIKGAGGLRKTKKGSSSVSGLLTSVSH